MKIELKKISFNERMSEETNCFIADLWINGKKVGYAKNEGRGGCTDYRGDSREDNELIAEAEEYCKTLPHDEFGEQSLEDVINKFLENHLNAKQQKKMEKLMESAILFGVPNGSEYHIIKYKFPLAVLVQTHKPFLIKKIMEIKVNECKNGVVILNTNLKALGLDI